MIKIEAKHITAVALTTLVVCLIVRCWDPISEFLILFANACTPVIVGLAFAFAANIPMSFIESHIAPNSTDPRIVSLRRPIALMLTITLSVLLVVAIIIVVVPQFASALLLIQQHIPEYIESLKGQFGADFLDSALEMLMPESSSTSVSALTTGDFDQEKAMQILQSAGGFIGGFASGVASFAGSAVSIVLSIALSTALLAEKDTFRVTGTRLLYAYLPKKRADHVMHVAGVFNTTFRGFLWKQFSDAVVIGVLCTVVMLLLNLPYAAAVGTLLGLSALVPLIGVYVGMALGALLVFAVSPWQALAFLVISFLIVQVEASFISPMITVNTLGIPGIWVLIAITVFGAVWGILGILVGVPLFSTLYKLIHENLEHREAKKALKPIEPTEPAEPVAN